jgi:hypothetical protein
MILPLREKVTGAGAENTVVDQGVRSKRIRPEWLMHQEPMQKPFEKAGVQEETDKPCRPFQGFCHSFLFPYPGWAKFAGEPKKRKGQTDPLPLLRRS